MSIWQPQQLLPQQVSTPTSVQKHVVPGFFCSHPLKSLFTSACPITQLAVRIAQSESISAPSPAAHAEPANPSPAIMCVCSCILLPTEGLAHGRIYVPRALNGWLESEIAPARRPSVSPKNVQISHTENVRPTQCIFHLQMASVDNALIL